MCEAQCVVGEVKDERVRACMHRAQKLPLEVRQDTEELGAA